MNDNLEIAFKSTVLDDKALELAGNFTELALDSVISDGLLKDIPIVGSLISVFKITQSVRDSYTLKKILLFLHNLSSVTQEEKKRFFDRISEDHSSLAEKLIIILDRLDEFKKAKMIANAFKFYMREAINKKTFMRLVNMIERCYIDDLNGLVYEKAYHKFAIPHIYQYNPLQNPTTQQNLINVGVLIPKYDLVEENFAGFPTFDNAKPIRQNISVSEIGTLLALIIDYREEDFRLIVESYRNLFGKDYT